MRIVLGLIIVVVLGFLAIDFGDATASTKPICPEVRSGSGVTRVVVDTTRGTHRISPQFFGFNLTWVPFQFDLWDAERRVVRPGVVDALREFGNAVYRFPGGGVSNRYDWQAAVGPLSNRSEQTAVEWRGPLVADFGVNEYLDFLADVQGTPWFVANIHGELDDELPIVQLQSRNAGLARYLSVHSPVSVLRWELGNELDREKKWDPKKYAESASAISAAIQSAQPASRFVAFLQDYDAFPDMTASEYNRALVAQLPERVSDFSLHSYYDGSPGGPPIPNRIRHICRSIADVKQVRPQTSPAVWITEHARWPGGKTDEPNWKQTWGKTSDLEAALGTADFLIATAQLAEVRGVFIHNLGPTTGRPWPLFHVSASGMAYPSAVLHSLSVLRAGLLEQVISTETHSDNKSGYAGGYDVRAVAMANADGQRYALWVVNRLGTSNPIVLRWEGFAGQHMRVRHHYLTDEVLSANNVLNADRIVPAGIESELLFDGNGETNLTVPPYSVSTFILTPAGRSSVR